MALDREALIRRHDVVSTAIDPTSPLSVGNGELCATVDVTGLQTFPEQYPVRDPAGGTGTLLGTQSQWGWHSTPRPEGADLDATRRLYRTPRGEVPYVDAGAGTGSDDSALDEITRWLRANPHRLDLGRIGLVVAGDEPGPSTAAGTAPAPDPDEAGEGAEPPTGPSAYRVPSASDLGPARQVLDLWSGVLDSDVVLAGHRLRVTTACHPTLDALAVRVVRGGTDGDAGGDPQAAEAPGAAGGGAPAAAPVAVRIAFPYGSEAWAAGADWSAPERHTTTVTAVPGGAVVDRTFDGGTEPHYRVRLATSAGAVVEKTGPHEVVVTPSGDVLDLVVAFLPDGGLPDGARPERPGQVETGPGDVDAVLEASRRHWARFWGSGAALDLSGSTDPRAAELERRAVLSQFLTAVHCAGSLPPQETGLMVNSWRGRFHLEMHWWHAAHFPMWGRPELLERSMGWYQRILPAAQETARIQGYAGARWPKQVGPDGRESPSHIGTFLLWQQPHVIHLAELLRRATGDAAVQRYAELVDQTARFMADVAEPTPDGYGLGPPLVPAQESYAHLRDRVVNPPFELAYWSWALSVAQEWRERAGLPREPFWDEVGQGMAEPLVRDGRYEAIGVEPYTIREDHPSMVYGLGVVPANDVMDPDVVRATFAGALADWDWQSTWGWDYPALAMTAARLGDPEAAVDALLMDLPKNTHVANGHNRQTDHLPVYLPGNGGLLAALALMAGGWDGSPDRPGFPDDGWVVRHEGFVRAP